MTATEVYWSAVETAEADYCDDEAQLAHALLAAEMALYSAELVSR